MSATKGDAATASLLVEIKAPAASAVTPTKGFLPAYFNSKTSLTELLQELKDSDPEAPVNESWSVVQTLTDVKRGDWALIEGQAGVSAISGFTTRVERHSAPEGRSGGAMIISTEHTPGELLVLQPNNYWIEVDDRYRPLAHRLLSVLFLRAPAKGSS